MNIDSSPFIHNNNIVTDANSLHSLLADRPVMEMSFVFPCFMLIIPLLLIWIAFLILFSLKSLAEARFTLLLLLVGYLYLPLGILLSGRMLFEFPRVIGLFMGLLCSALTSIILSFVYCVFFLIAFYLFERYGTTKKIPVRYVPYVFLKWATSFVVVFGTIWLFILMGWCNEKILDFYKSSPPVPIFAFVYPGIDIVGILSLWFSGVIFISTIGLFSGLNAVKNEVNYEWYRKLFRTNESKSANETS